MEHPIKTILEGFDPIDLSNARTVMVSCLDAGYSAENLISYVDDFLRSAKENQLSVTGSTKESSRSFPCTKCGNQMALQPVKADKGRENKFGWKSVLRCYSCGYEEFSLENIQIRVRESWRRK